MKIRTAATVIITIYVQHFYFINLRILAFIRLPVPPASRTNPTSPMSGVLNSDSPLFALNFVMDDDCLLDTNAEEIHELNTKINEIWNRNFIVEFIW